MEMTEQRSFVDRLIGAARLDSSVYEEVEHDRDATGQAAAVVVAGSIAAGVAAIGDLGVAGLIFGVVGGLVGWAVYAWVTYFIGTKILAGAETSADWGEVARTLGFANGPRILLVIGVVSVLNAFVSLIVAIWVLITTVVAVRAALDIGTGRAIVVALIGVIVASIILGVAYGIADAIA